MEANIDVQVAIEISENTGPFARAVKPFVERGYTTINLWNRTYTYGRLGLDRTLIVTYTKTKEGYEIFTHVPLFTLPKDLFRYIMGFK